MKPVFGDVARMIGGLLEDEKKKKKKTVSASKYAVIDTKKLMAALPARPALFPRAFVPPALAAAPAGPRRRRRTNLEIAHDNAREKEDIARAAQEKLDDIGAAVRDAAQAVANAKAARSSAKEKRRLNAILRAAERDMDNQADELRIATDESTKALDAFGMQQAALGIAREPAEEKEEYADALPAKKVKQTRRSLDETFASTVKNKAAKAEAAAVARALKAEEAAEAKAEKIYAADMAKRAKAEAKLAAKEAKVEAEGKAAKAAITPAMLRAFESKSAKAAKAAKAAEAKEELPVSPSRRRVVPPPPAGSPPEGARKAPTFTAASAGPLTGLGRFLGRFE